MSELVRRAQPLLGTFVEVTVPADHAGAIDDAFDAVRHVHHVMSFHEAGSDVGRINRAQIGTSLECDPQTVEVLAAARRLYMETGGLFDISIAPRLVRFGYLPANPAERLRLFGGRSDDIQIVAEDRVTLTRRVMIDLGGIAKGYAVDCAIGILQAIDVPSAMVNAGGDLRCYGAQPWPVQLREADGGLGEEIPLQNRAIASSANRLTRRRKLTGIVTPHIGPDRSPVRIDQTISVVADCCMTADAMTKVAMTNRQLANNLLERSGGYVLENSMIQQGVSA